MVAHGEGLAELQFHPVQQGLLHRGRRNAGQGLQRLPQAHPLAVGPGQLDLAGQGIVRIDRPELDHPALARGRFGHAARCFRIGVGAGAVEHRPLPRRERAVGLDGQIAAQDLLGLGRQAPAERLGGRSGGGDGRHAQRQAGQEDAEALHARPQLAPGEPQR